MSKTILSKELTTDLMLYDSEKDAVHVLNDTAKLIYKLYNEGKGLRKIENCLRKAYHIKEDPDIYMDIKTCLNALQEKNLLA